MLAKPLLSHILDDEAMTRGLGDPEARVLIEWLVEQADQTAQEAAEPEVRGLIRRLCSHGRAISCFVRLWCHEGRRGAALQLAGAERFGWPLPTRTLDPCELMQAILNYETHHPTWAGPPRRAAS